MTRVIVFGPISWDSIITIDEYPDNGGFAQGISRVERAGGTGLNIAAALASASVEIELHSYIGTDIYGDKLRNQIKQLDVPSSHIHEVPGPSLHAFITIDGSGERTVFAMEKNRFPEITLMNEFSENQIVVFPIWRDFYLPHLERANQAGAKTVVGVGAILNQTVTASIMIGSEKDAFDFDIDLHRFPITIVTRGAEGVLVHTPERSFEVPVIKVKAEDATGAGDTFLSGFLVGLSRESTLESAVRIGINWAAAAITKQSSIPPMWQEDFNVS